MIAAKLGRSTAPEPAVNSNACAPKIAERPPEALQVVIEPREWSMPELELRSRMEQRDRVARVFRELREPADLGVAFRRRRFKTLVSERVENRLLKLVETGRNVEPLVRGDQPASDIRREDGRNLARAPCEAWPLPRSFGHSAPSRRSARSSGMRGARPSGAAVSGSRP